MITVRSPHATYSGKSTYGPTTLYFTKGVAEVEEVSDALRAYLVATGYTLEEPKPKRKSKPKATEPAVEETTKEVVEESTEEVALED